MDVKNEIKSLIAKKASTLKDVCASLEQVKNKKFVQIILLINSDEKL